MFMNFFAKYKKIILTAGFILVVFLLGYLLYAVFFKTPAETPITTTPGSTTTPAGFPASSSGSGQIADSGQTQILPESETEAEISEKALGGLTKTTELNNSPSLAATLSGNGTDLQYYNKEDGKFYKISKDGEITALTDKTFYNVESIKWSPNKEKAILEYPDGANVLYNFSTDEQVTLPSHWKDFDFSPDSGKIVMKSVGLDADNRWLAIANEDGSKSQAIEAIGEKDATVYPSWSPNNQTIAMYTEGTGFNRQEVFFVGLNGENFKSMIIEGRGFQSEWSPKGDQLVYSVYSSDNDLKPMLWIAGAQGDDIGQGRKSLGVETWAEKCTFASDTDLYCAVPKELEKGAGLFPELAQNTYDQLYKIDLETGLKQLVATPDGTYNMTDLIISENGYQLYFTDQTTETIHKINLK
jgi:sugar lactone lactonase YvrE